MQNEHFFCCKWHRLILACVTITSIDGYIRRTNGDSAKIMLFLVTGCSVLPQEMVSGWIDRWRGHITFLWSTLALGNCLVGLDLLFSSETTMKNYILQITLRLLISVLFLSKLMTSSAGTIAKQMATNHSNHSLVASKPHYETRRTYEVVFTSQARKTRVWNVC